MYSKHLWATVATVFALSVFGPRSPGVWAQTQMAACRAGWEWNENSLSQDPCVISSMLDAACRGIRTYTIPPLNSSQSYVPPRRDSTNDLRCDCDTVMYSLYMACSTCQGGLIYSWSRWIAQCDSVYVTQYPHDVAQGTRIPRWAFYDITGLPDKTYNDTVSLAVGRDPEAMPKQIPTNSVGTTRTSSSTRGGPTGPVYVPPKRKSNAGAIAGGVVGGLALLGIIGAGFFFARKRRQQQLQGGVQQPPPPTPHTPDVQEYYKAQPTSPTSPSPSHGNLPYNPYYNPNDPMTFPPPMGDGQSSMTYTNMTTSPPPGPQYQGPGRYSGIPEV